MFVVKLSEQIIHKVIVLVLDGRRGRSGGAGRMTGFLPGHGRGILRILRGALPLQVMASSDVAVAAGALSSLAHSLRSNDSLDLWRNLQLAARTIADALRVKDPARDNHSPLGRSSLPTTLTTLLSLALHGASVPDFAYTAAVNELLRVAANLCMDHSTFPVISFQFLSSSRGPDENRGALLEAGFPQATSALLENYVELIPQPPSQRPFPFTAPHLYIIRSAIGVLLNSSVGYGAYIETNDFLQSHDAQYRSRQG